MSGIPPSAVAKYNWAQVHFQRLQGETKPFFEGHPYRIRAETDADMLEHRFYIDFTSDPLLEQWALMFGDGVHNLRSALDHAVYAIGVKESGIDPPPDYKRLEFLITEDDTQWDGSVWHLKSLSVTAQAAIKGLQPRGCADEFVLTPLGGLQEYDNQDKHRTVKLGVLFPRSLNHSYSGLPPGAECVIDVALGPVRPDAPVLTLRCDQAAPDVQMKDDFTLDIGISHIRRNGKEATLLTWETVDMMNKAVTFTLNGLAPYC